MQQFIEQFPPLECGVYDVKITWKNNIPYIYDIWRKKYIKLTPEEWVRQNFLHYAIKRKQFPLTRLHVEYEINVYGRKKRIDCLVTNEKLTPIAIIECKAPTIAIHQTTMQQIGTYNIVLKVPTLILTNGNTTLCSHKVHDSQIFSHELPDYSTLLTY
jgi:hypothetical protein